MIVPDALTKCRWDGAIMRERSKDWSDYSDYDNTGVVSSYPSVADYLSEIDHFEPVAP
jgi:hypothetical protein